MKRENKFSSKGSEINGLALMIVSAVILILTVFDSFLAPIGAKAVKGFIMGVFGFSHYALFVTLFSFGFILFKGYTVQVSIKRIFSVVGMFICALLILHLISSARFLGPDVSFASYISKCYDSAVTFGGVILGTVIYPIYSVLKLVGSYILFSALFVIFAVTFIDFSKIKEYRARNIIANTQKDFRREFIEERPSNSLFVSTIIKTDKKAASLDKADKKVQKIYSLSQDFYSALEENKKKYDFSLDNRIQPKGAINTFKTDFVAPSLDTAELKTEPPKPNFYVEPKPEKIVHTEKNDFVPPKKIVAPNVIDAEKRSKEILEARLNTELKQSAQTQAAPRIPNIIDGDLISQKLKESRATKVEDSVIKEFKEILKRGAKNQVYSEPQIYTDQTQASMQKKALPDEQEKEEVKEEPAKSFNNFDDDTQYFKITPPRQSFDLSQKINEVEKEDKDDKEDDYLNQENKEPSLNGQLNVEDLLYSRKPVEKPQAQRSLKPKTWAKYIKPPIDLLQNNSTYTGKIDDDINENIAVLEQVLYDFKTPAKVIGVCKGPAVTRYELQMPQGISVKKISERAEDIAYAMASNGKVRIETHIPGKQAVAIEIPNHTIEVVSLKEIIESREFVNHPSPLSFALGKDITGKNIIGDLIHMPHLLVAGATNSGKSSCLNALITSLIFKSSPSDVRLILIDPKRVEFTSYRGLPHLLIENPITESEHALNAFEWAIDEAEKRFELFVDYKVRDIHEFNALSVVQNGDVEKLPYIVIVVDELADLMLQAKRDFEDRIRIIAQKSRAAGIHLVLATQRPSVDIITGTIKANLPSRIAFAVTSIADSKTILDQGGAEMLLGRGDMLFAPIDKPEPIRVQGAYVTNQEVCDVVDFVKENNPSDFDEELEKLIFNTSNADNNGVTVANYVDEADPNLANIVRMFIELGQASTTLIQRRFRYGYAKAARIMDQLELKKYISAFDGTNKPRKVLITPEQFEEEFGEPFDLNEHTN
ncbi:MAG TPA: DNA translocase FtsK [Clostridia bacterium]